VQQGKLARQGSKDLVGFKASRVHTVRREPLVLRALWDYKGRKEIKVLLVREGHAGLRVQEGRSAPLPPLRFHSTLPVRLSWTTALAS